MAPHKRSNDVEKGSAFYEELFARLRYTPGVRSARRSTRCRSAASAAIAGLIEAERHTTEDQADEEVRFVSAGYFSTMQIPIVEGRELTSRDLDTAPRVAVVNAALARKYWPDGGAIGRRIAFSQREPSWYQVVGVVGNIKHAALDAKDKPELYVPYAQPLFAGATVRPMFVVVRTDQDPIAARDRRTSRGSVARFRSASQRPSMDQRLCRIAVVEAFQYAAVRAVRGAGRCSAALASTDSSPTRKRTDARNRRATALGARPRDVLAMLVGEGMILGRPLVPPIGAVAALAVTRVMAGLLLTSRQPTRRRLRP